MTVPQTVLTLERKIAHHSARLAPTMLRLSLAIVFLWFGLPKFVPGLSSADQLSVNTVEALTLHVMPTWLCRFLLACLETAIGVGFLTWKFPRTTLALFFGQMLGTFTPLVIFSSETWKTTFIATLEGQYIIKNIVLVSAGVALLAIATAQSALPTQPRIHHELPLQRVHSAR